MQYSEQDDRGYPWLFFHANHQWKITLLVSLLILSASVGFFLWGSHISDDMGGDSFVGLVFAVASTVFMFLAAVSFSLHRRSPKRVVGQLNAVLNWHVCFGTISLVMVFLHSFGNYNPRTGTYALYGMIALVISGIIGRILDRMMPRFMTQKVNSALTAQGEDRIESISQEVQSIIKGGSGKQSQRVANRVSSSARAATAVRQEMMQDSWDLAYGAPQMMERSSQSRASRRSSRSDRDSQEYMSALGEIQRALKQEMFFRYVIRYWRIFHIALAIVTVGLTLWHIEYAFSLIIPAIQKYGFGYLLPWP